MADWLRLGTCFGQLLSVTGRFRCGLSEELLDGILNSVRDGSIRRKQKREHMSVCLSLLRFLSVSRGLSVSVFDMSFYSAALSVSIKRCNKVRKDLEEEEEEEQKGRHQKERERESNNLYLVSCVIG